MIISLGADSVRAKVDLRLRKGFMKLNPQKNNRILVIDDNHAIHEDIRRILIGASDVSSSLEEEASLFGETMEVSETPVFKIDSAYQGQEGLALVEKSLQDNKPYALAFVDVHMPPGWDGIEATCKIWDRYPELQVIIITAHSDHTWEEMLKLLGYSERMLVLEKAI
jgi:CheY-like chemotaxis protein